MLLSFAPFAICTRISCHAFIYVYHIFGCAYTMYPET